MNWQVISSPLRKCAFIRLIWKPGDKKQISIFPYLCLLFLNWLNITRPSRQKYELTGNFKSFKKMSFHPVNMQTRRQKKTISISSYFSCFILTVLILPDRVDKNINWQVISSHLRKGAYIRPICKPGDKKMFIFPFPCIFFLTNLILPNRTDKNINSQVISCPLWKCAYIRPICKSGDKKKFFIFPYFCLFFLTDLILPGRAFKNINWQVISSSLRKCAYIRPICKAGDK